MVITAISLRPSQNHAVGSEPMARCLQVGSALRADLVAFAWVGSGPRHDIAVAEQFSGDGHGSQPFRIQLFSLQPPEPGYQLPMAERPNPELPMPVPVTRHHGLLWFTFALLHRSSAPICTFARSLSGPRALRSSCPRSLLLPTCQLAHVPPRGFAALTFAQAAGRFAPLHCLFLFHRASEPPGL